MREPHLKPSDRTVASSNVMTFRPGAESPCPLPILSERGYVLRLYRGDVREFMVWLNFPGRRGPAYPLQGYRAIAEFREMLSGIDPSKKVRQCWTGDRFVGVAGECDGGWDYMFRGRNDAICFLLSAEDWTAVRELFRRAWANPAIQEAWGVLTSELEAQ